MNANAVAEKAAKKPPVEEREVKFKPMGSTEEMVLTVNYIKQFLTTPTRTGQMPTNADIIKYMMLCKARALNPWEGDAYLTGYDNSDGTATFSLITAVQALLKRAELCPEFDGLESGVIVLLEDGRDIERRGTIVKPGEMLIGGYARCLRKDRKMEFYSTVQFSTYDTGRSRWKKDPAGMIAKVAKAGVLRDAFPNHLAGLYTQDEMGKVVEGEVTNSSDRPNIAQQTVGISEKSKTASELTAVLKARNGQTVEKDEPESEVDHIPEVKKIAKSEREAELEILFESLMAEMVSCHVDAIQDIERDINTSGFDDPEKSTLNAQLVKAKKRLGY